MNPKFTMNHTALQEKCYLEVIFIIIIIILLIKDCLRITLEIKRFRIVLQSVQQYLLSNNDKILRNTSHIISSFFSSLPCIHTNTHLVLNILIKSSICVHDKERCWREESYYISILHQGHEIFKFSSRNRKLRMNEVVLKMAQKKDMWEC